MAHNKFSVFVVFIFNFLTNTFEVDNLDSVSEELIVSHYDRTKIQNNRMHSLSKVAESNISTKNIASATITLSLPEKLSNRPVSNNVFCQGL